MILSLVVFCFLQYLWYHLQRMVYDSDQRGGHDSDPSVGPGYFSLTREGVSFLFFSLLFV